MVNLIERTTTEEYDEDKTSRTVVEKYEPKDGKAVSMEEQIRKRNEIFLPHLKGPLTQEELRSCLGLPIYIKELGEWGVASHIGALYNNGFDDVHIVRGGENGAIAGYLASKGKFELYTFPFFDVETN